MTSVLDAPTGTTPFPGSPATALVCRECGASTPLAAVHVCTECFGPLEVAYDLRPPRHPRGHRARAADDVAVRGAAPRRPGRGHPGHPRRRDDPAAPRRHPRRRARHAAGRAVGQGRQRQPDPLVQGPGRLGRAVRRPPARLLGRRLRLHRQPRQLGRRARRPRRDALGRLHPQRPRAGQGRRRPPSTAARWSPSTAPTTTSTGCAPRSPATTRTGPSSTSTSARTTPRAPRPSGTRSPSSSAGACPSRWSCRWRPARC